MNQEIKNSKKDNEYSVNEIFSVLDNLFDCWIKKPSPTLTNRFKSLVARNRHLYKTLSIVKFKTESYYLKIRQQLADTDKSSANNSDNNINNIVLGNIFKSFSRLRGLPDGLEPEVIEKITELSSEIQNVACVGISSKTLQVLYLMFQSGVCRFRLLGSSEDVTGSSCLKDEVSSFILQSIRTGENDIDTLVVDGRLDTSLMNLLDSATFSGCKLIVTNDFVATSSFPSMFGDATFRHGDTACYRVSKPSITLEREVDNRWTMSHWPLHQMPFKFPAMMPSGRPWPKISIVTPTYNQSEYLEETIRSVLLQDYPNLEYIVIDGCSTDNTLHILERYRSELAYCISEQDRGQSHALNKGFALCTGDILAWLNSDDCYLPGTLWRIALAFDSYETDMIAGGCVLREGISLNPDRIHHSRLDQRISVPLPLNKLLDIDGSWLAGDFFYQPEVFWRKEIWDKCGACLDESLYFSMDYDFWVRAAIHGGTIVTLPDALSVYRVHSNQKTWGGDLPYLTELRRVNEKYINLCQQ